MVSAMSEILHPLQSLSGAPPGIAADAQPQPDALPLPAVPLPPTPNPALSVDDRRRRPPLFSYALTLLLLAVFVLELEFTVDPTGPQFALTPHSLYVLGGLTGPALITSWDYWRFATGPLLHASGPHVVLNCIGLIVVAPALERAIGWRWTAAIFVLAGVVGEIVLLFSYQWGLVGVGASGGIAGLYGAALPLAFALPNGRIQRSLAIRSMIGVVLFLFPSLSLHQDKVVAGLQVADTAHVAGIALGLALGFLLAATWQPSTATPRYQRLAAVVVGLFAIVALGSLAPLALRYDSRKHAAARGRISQFTHTASRATPWGNAISPGVVVQPDPPPN